MSRFTGSLLLFVGAWIGLFIIAGAAQAQTPSPTPCAKRVVAPRALHQVYPAHVESGITPRVTFTLEGDQLKVGFDVLSPSLNAKKALAVGQYPYEFDAVEVFVSVADPKGPHLPYYEFELSPYNQTFFVKIPGSGQPFINNYKVDVDHSVQMIAAGSPAHWRGELVLPLKALGWNGDAGTVVGNAFAVIGASPAKTYWSLSLPVQAKPNFHLPQFFKPLLDSATCSN